MEKKWKRIILLVDMDAFFASVEQLDHPEWIGKPLAVTNGEQGMGIITASYEARAFGINTGTRVVDAKKRCPHLICTTSNHKRYQAVSKQVMDALKDMTPDIEISSVDEAYLDLTHCQRLYKTPLAAAEEVQKRVWEAAGITCSVGVAGDKSTAKYAASLQKPAGLVVIPPWEAEETLAPVPVSKLCGIGKKTSAFLARYGVYSCGDMKKIPVSVLTKRMGPWGYRMWLMCQGKDTAPVVSEERSLQSLGHSKVLPPRTDDRETVLTFFRRMSEMVATRLRKNGLTAQHFLITMKINFKTSVKHKQRLAIPSADSHDIFPLCQKLMDDNWRLGITVQQVAVMALDPKPQDQQQDLFNSTPKKQQQQNKVVDEINDRFGAGSILSARLSKKE